MSLTEPLAVNAKAFREHAIRQLGYVAALDLGAAAGGVFMLPYLVLELEGSPGTIGYQ